VAFARAVLAMGGSEPTEDAVRAMGLALQRTGHGATWAGLMALAEADETPDVPPIDPMRLTPAEREEAGRLRAIIEAGGLAAISDEDLTLAECLRSKRDGLRDESCLS